MLASCVLVTTGKRHEVFKTVMMGNPRSKTPDLSVTSNLQELKAAYVPAGGSGASAAGPKGEGPLSSKRREGICMGHWRGTWKRSRESFPSAEAGDPVG